MVSSHVLEILILVRSLVPFRYSHLFENQRTFESLWRVDTRQRRGKRSRVFTYLPRNKVFRTKVLAAHWVAQNMILVLMHLARLGSVGIQTDLRIDDWSS
jgi:hypothetical protein